MFKHLFVIAIAGLLATAGCSKKSGDASIDNAADYESKLTAFWDRYVGVFTADGTDCDKLVKDLTALFDDHKALIDSAKAWEKAHPEDKRALKDKMADARKDFFHNNGRATTDCKDHKDLWDAMRRMPNGL
jgi:hypothetical protein